ncbi:MAG: serine/threonine-protein kinase [Ignavibacteriaceae bacterium]|jgi:serine/threonine protein kinase
MIGKQILHYKILEKLGEGGMGVVYLAYDTKLKREVAIKFLPHHISANKEDKQRFEIEAQAAAYLNHPNISIIHAIEESDGQTFFVMEYIEGKELKEIIERKHVGAEYIQPLQMNDVISYAIQIAEGIEAAHKKGIIHRISNFKYIVKIPEIP